MPQNILKGHKRELKAGVKTFYAKTQKEWRKWLEENHRSGKVVYIFDSPTETHRHADEALKICLLLKRTDNVNN
jgi:hypothetical protein